MDGPRSGPQTGRDGRWKSGLAEDLVRVLIVSGLQQKGNAAPAVIDHLDRLEALGEKAMKAALKAQFLANMSASFSAGVARVMTTKTQPSTEEKQEFMAQMDSWAENFAEGEPGL